MKTLTILLVLTFCAAFVSAVACDDTGGLLDMWHYCPSPDGGDEWQPEPCADAGLPDAH